MITDRQTGSPSRRRLLGLLGAAAATGLLGACAPGTTAPATSTTSRVSGGMTRGSTPGAGSPTAAPVAGAAEAWQQLAVGNARFVDGVSVHPHSAVDRRESLVDGQQPIACVLGCVDSRVPPELVFDQGLGDLLTVRTAGGVLDEAVIGSVEYGVEHLGLPLVVVLGHTGCGAVQATVDVMNGAARPRGDVAALVHAIEPAVRAVPTDDPDAFLAACVAEQARQVAEALPERSLLIAEAVQARGARIMAATYNLVDGRVTAVA